MFEKVKIEASRLQQKQFEAQQMKREHVQKFIDRFRYKASLYVSFHV
jgi:ATP-binding cassette, subfamily F, member 3